MSKLLFFSAILLTSLVGCATPPVPDERVSDELEQVNANLVKLEESLTTQMIKICEENYQLLITENRKANRKRSRQAAKQCSDSKDSKPPTDEKLLFGAVEKVTLTKEELTMDARIDTGADTSSIGIYGSTRFERDGEKWVRFTLDSEEDSKVYEYPIYDTVRIKQSGVKTESRMEIKMDIEVGGKEYRNQIFNLADRSHLEHQLLIGRTFLRDIAIVDVSRKKLLGR